jgi:hypothetical protein
MAAGEKSGLGLYLDVPPADLEASALFDTLDSLLSSRRESSRDAPSFVRGEAVRSWISAKSGRSASRISYFYTVFRDLIGQIPIVGPFIRALLPQSAPITLSADDSTAPMRFLMRRSKTKQVVLVIDNVQFLPFAVREMLTAELLEPALICGSCSSSGFSGRCASTGRLAKAARKGWTSTWRTPP